MKSVLACGLLLGASSVVWAVNAPFDVRLRSFDVQTGWNWRNIDPSWMTFEEISPGSNAWRITLTDSPANDPGNTWTITGTGDPLPSTASFEQARNVNGGPVDIIISGTEDVQFSEARVNDVLGEGCVSFGGLVGQYTNKIRFVLVTSGDVSGDIECSELGRLEAGDDISADIATADAALSGPIVLVIAGGRFSGSLNTTLTSIKSFIATQYTGDVSIDGSIGRFDANVAPITGTLTCDAIDLSLSPLAGVFFDDDSSTDISIDSDLPGTTITINGDFGGQIQIDGDLAPNSKIEINGTLLSTGEIDIRGEMLADSEIQVGLIGVPPAVETGGRIEIRDEIRDDAEIGVLDDFNGQMILDDLEGGVTIFGDAGATSLISMDTLAFNLGGSLFIGDALGGQVIINQQDDVSTWSGFVWANGYEFQESEAQPEQAPHYDVLSDDLGGGAIGLVPFDLHGPDTVAANAGSLSQSSGGQAPQSIELHHYGRVLDVSAPGALPVLVERTTQYQVPGQPIVWTDVSDEFEASIVGRVLTISAKAGEDGFTCAHDYRITPEPGRLVCDDLATDTVDVASYMYEFGVRCKIDLSGNGIIDTPDPVLWVADPVDVNDDGLFDVNDLGDIMAEIE